MKHICYLSIGSNMPSRLGRLDRAVKTLEQAVGVEAVSEAISSNDYTGLGAPYLNIAVRCTTDMDIDALREAIAAIESKQGRRPDSKELGHMPVDIDIVVFDGDIISQCDFSQPFFQICYSQIKL